MMPALLIIHCVECYDGAYFCRFACRYQSGDGSRDDDEQCGFDANIKSYGGIEKHRLLENTRIDHLMAHCGVHIKVGTDAAQHTDVAKYRCDDDALNDN